MVYIGGYCLNVGFSYIACVSDDSHLRMLLVLLTQAVFAKLALNNKEVAFLLNAKCNRREDVGYTNRRQRTVYMRDSVTLSMIMLTYAVDVCWARWPGSCHALVTLAKVRQCSSHYFSRLTFRLCLTTVSNIMIVRWCSGVTCNWCVSMDIVVI